MQRGVDEIAEIFRRTFSHADMPYRGRVADAETALLPHSRRRCRKIDLDGISLVEKHPGRDSARAFLAFVLSVSFSSRRLCRTLRSFVHLLMRVRRCAENHKAAG